MPVMTMRDKRDAAVAELLSTETSYVSQMKLLVDVFVLPLERWAADLEAQREAGEGEGDAESISPEFTEEDCTKIFANAKQLGNFNRQFLIDLRKAHGDPSLPGQDVVSPIYGGITGEGNREGADGGPSVLSAVASMSMVEAKLEDDPFKPVMVVDADRGPRQMLEVFLKSAPFLKMYSLYVNNFDRAREHLAKLENDCPSFAAFLSACERQKPCRGLRLRDFLILPVQRIPRYRLMLETILQHTHIESTMHSKVEESLSTMGGIASKINADMSLQQQKNKVYELQQDFGGADFVTASRLFVKEGELSKVARNGVEKLHFVLFNDLLVYGQPKRRKSVLRGDNRPKQLYHQRREINLNKCFIVDAPSYSSRRSSFLGESGLLVVSENKSFMITASTAVEKDAWLQAIRLCMIDLSTNVESREKLCSSQSFKEEKSSSSSVSSLARPSRWSLSSTHSSLPASAPRSVWVPGKDGLKGTSPVDFSLPSWAGVRTTCGCLSLTELTLGKEGLTVAALTDISNVMMQIDDHAVDIKPYAVEPLQPGMDEDDYPRQVSFVASLKPAQPLGLRLREVQHISGGGMIVMSFPPKSAGKKAGLLRGDRLTRVDGVPVFKASDVIRAMKQPHSPHEDSSGRFVPLEVLRGFPKIDKLWLPSPLGSPGDQPPAFLSPPSSAVESRSDDELTSSVALSSPGIKTFDGIGETRGMLGFAGGGFGEATESTSPSVKEKAVVAPETETETEDHDTLAMAVSPTPETKIEFPGEYGGDPSGPRHGVEVSGVSGGSSSSGTAGGVLQGPAPQQANDNAGGGPAELFVALNTDTNSNKGPGHQLGRWSEGTLGVGSALAACLALEASDPFNIWEDSENLKPVEYKEIYIEPVAGEKMEEQPPVQTLGRSVVEACVAGDNSTTVTAEEEDDNFPDTHSTISSSSSGSSLFLTAVSPSRIPPPLISMNSSTLPPPSVSMASSVVSGPLSNPLISPTNSETTDPSMPWLRPLPPPPPQKDVLGDISLDSFSSAPRHSPPPTPSMRGSSGGAYPSGRWVQTPPSGEPQGS